MNNSEIKDNILAQRDAFDPTSREAMSQRLCAHFLTSPLLTSAHTIMVFSSFRSEVDCSTICRHLLTHGIRIVFPLCLRKKRTMELYSVENIDSLLPGVYGIPEPSPLLHAPVPAADVDLVLTPGSVFCTDGGRLGYGGGYYDRFFSESVSEALRIGLCFSFQVISHLKLQPHDQPMDMLLTECGFIVCHPGRGRYL